MALTEITNNPPNEDTSGAASTSPRQQVELLGELVLLLDDLGRRSGAFDRKSLNFTGPSAMKEDTDATLLARRVHPAAPALRVAGEGCSPRVRAHTHV